ncbi:MAG: hypothetical protein M3O23_01815 [Actinomycetota bacterium]|nr:hypothetical protein [Actinomycetota bacterium]
MHMHTEHYTFTDGRRRRRLVTPFAAGLALTLGLAACGDSEDQGTTPTTAPAQETSTTKASGNGAAGETVEVTAVDYSFQGIPDTVKAGTKFRLKNESERELHEVVAVRLADDEARSAEELVAEPSNLESLFTGKPDAVLIAAPGSDMPGAVVGDGTFTEPGRYLVLCAIPTGADPQEYLNAAEGADGPPDVAGGPPHFTQGMFAEFTVE